MTDQAALGEDDGPANRILRAARKRLFAFGYNALTMEELAYDLGMSKKTLYAHFAGKDAIVGAVLDAATGALRQEVSTIVADPQTGFTQKLEGLIRAVSSAYATASPVLMRDLQRFAPELHRKIDDYRSRMMPLGVGRLLRAGIANGMVRPDLDPEFAVEFFLQAMNGLFDQAVLERLGLTPQEVFEKAIGLFFWAVLTEAGRADFAKHPLKTS